MLATADPDTRVPIGVETRPVRLLLHADDDADLIRRALVVATLREATEGLCIPRDENREEFSTDPVRYLGWYLAYDLNAWETVGERERRYLGDDRWVDIGAFARIGYRSQPVCKRSNWRGGIFRDLDQKLRADIARTEDAIRSATTADQLAGLRAELGRLNDSLQRNSRQVLKQIPRHEMTRGNLQMWRAKTAFRHVRRIGRIDEWYERATNGQED